MRNFKHPNWLSLLSHLFLCTWEKNLPLTHSSAPSSSFIPKSKQGVHLHFRPQEQFTPWSKQALRVC